MSDLIQQRYNILKKIGEGGMAIVYLAEDIILGRQVALKMIRVGQIPPDQLPRAMERFRREAKSMSRFTNVPGIVSVHDYGEHEGNPFLVMGYMSNGTLKQLLGTPIPYQQAAEMLLPVAKALEVVHANGIVHRDIKPSNILIDAQDKLALADFGIAKTLETTDHTLTGTGMGVGTAAYMAPEQWRGNSSPQSDIYSLGVVYYEMITGQKPYEGETASDLYLRIVTGSFTDPRTFIKNLPRNVIKIIEKTLACETKSRYTDASKLCKALEKTEMSPNMKQTRSIRENSEQKLVSNSGMIESENETIDQFEIISKDNQFDLDGKPEFGHQKTIFRISGLVSFGLIVVGGLFFSLTNGLSWKKPDENGIATVTQQIAPTQETENMVAVTQTELSTAISTETPEPGTIPTITMTPTSAMEMITTRVRENDGKEQVFVPAGEFIMGNTNGSADEQPEHTVYLDAFWIDKYEITNADFTFFAWQQHYVTSAEVMGSSYVFTSIDWVSILNAYWKNPLGPSSTVDSILNHPVVHVSWQDASDYCEWAGGRLPTEAEWEKTARGTDQRIYPWGNESIAGSMANFGDYNLGTEWAANEIDDGYKFTAPAGSYPAGSSPYGAMDMAGNVAEWVADWYDENYYKTSPTENPSGPSDGNYRVLRGGSWNYNDNDLSTTNRHRTNQESTKQTYGFRCVMDSEE